MDGECINCGEVGNWCRCDEPEPDMTRDEILALKGRELDAAVARAMGWKNLTPHNPRSNFILGDDPSGLSVAKSQVPEYSTDGAHVVMAAIAGAPGGYSLYLENGIDNDGRIFWDTIITMPDGHDTGTVRRPTWQEAVCLAFLLAFARTRNPA